MKVKLLKTGSYSYSPIGFPVIEIKEEDVGSIIPLKKEYANRLIKFKCAEEVIVAGEEPEVTKKEVVQVVEVEEPEENEEELTKEELVIYLNKIIKGKDESEQKQIIQDWGILNLDHKVSKTKKVENMINDLVDLSE